MLAKSSWAATIGKLQFLVSSHCSSTFNFICNSDTKAVGLMNLIKRHKLAQCCSTVSVVPQPGWQMVCQPGFIKLKAFALSLINTTHIYYTYSRWKAGFMHTVLLLTLARVKGMHPCSRYELCRRWLITEASSERQNAAAQVVTVLGRLNFS